VITGTKPFVRITLADLAHRAARLVSNTKFIFRANRDRFRQVNQFQSGSDANSAKNGRRAVSVLSNFYHWGNTVIRCGPETDALGNR